MSNRPVETDIAIVGAGAAGLAAAHRLQAAGRDFVVLEGSHRIGGRAYTELLRDGEPFDLGAHWIHSPKVNPMFDFARRERALLEEEDEDDSEFYTVDAYFENGAWLPDSASDAMADYVRHQFDRVERAVAAGRESSIYELIDNDHRWAPYLYLFFGQDYTCDVDEISAADSVSFEHLGNDFAVGDGFGALLSRYGADVPVQLNEAVRKVDWSGEKVVLDTAKGTVLANKIILTVSTGVLAHRQIEFVPALPASKLAAIESLPMGSCTRIALSFASDVLDRWPADFTVCPDGQVPLHFRNRPFGYNYVEVVTGGRLAAWMEQSGEAATLDYVTNYLAEIETDRRQLQLDRHIVSAWDNDPWTLGSYSYARPGKLDARQQLGRSVDNRLLFAGEAAIVGQQATVHGAITSGQIAAAAV
ncbi:MAG: NAD(P)/FAD-dependent oxidoreductase [Pseudomonadota bacterium]